jgi:hypothetical protein
MMFLPIKEVFDEAQIEGEMHRGKPPERMSRMRGAHRSFSGVSRFKIRENRKAKMSFPNRGATLLNRNCGAIVAVRRNATFR